MLQRIRTLRLQRLADLRGSLSFLPARKAACLSTLPLELLSPDEEMQQTLADWGIRTLPNLLLFPKTA